MNIKYQIKIKNSIETEIVQRILFGLGYYWRQDNPHEILLPNHLIGDTIQAWYDNVLTHGYELKHIKTLTFDEFIDIVDKL